MLRLRLYSRRGCPLCDDMIDELEACCRGRPVSVEVVDVDLEPALRQRYGRRVPVLVLADDPARELGCGRLDAARLSGLLPPPGTG